MSQQTALLSGATGQDGSYLAELLLEKGFEVHGIIRRSSTFHTERIDHIFDQLHLHYGDLLDGQSISDIVRDVQPNVIFHMGTQSHVMVSFQNPCYSVQATVMGTLHILEAARRLDNGCRVYNAASSEMFGSTPPPQSETTPFHPRSPYGCAKVAGFWLATNYREAYGLHAVNGILFNHESNRRGPTFVTRKITRAIPRLLRSSKETLRLGTLSPRRDWGHAKDYMDAVYLMTVEHPVAEDFVIAAGEAWSVQDFLDVAFGLVLLKPHERIVYDAAYKRPAEVEHLLGDATKARKLLGWRPRITFKQMVREMVEHDLQAAGMDPAQYIVG